MAVGFPAKTNFATGDVLTATNVNDITGTLNLLQSTLYPAGRNKIINGDMRINQRAFTSVTANATYTFDRFRTSFLNGTVTYTPQLFTAGTAPVAGYEAANFLQCAVSGQSGASDIASIVQPIEDVRTFAGQTIVVSVWAKATSGTPSIAVEAAQGFGTGGSPSSAVNTAASANQVISTSWARYSFTINVPSISGKTLGTANDSSLTIRIFFSAGSDFNTRSNTLGIQNNTFQIWGLQAEAASTGSTASPFQTASGSIAGELALCQRYYVRFIPGDAYTTFANGSADSTTSAKIAINFPVTLRSAVTAVDYSTLCLNDGATITAVTTATLSTKGSQQTNLVANVASGLTQFRPYQLLSNNSTSGYVGFSAEL
jgi:hypothetical protein